MDRLSAFVAASVLLCAIGGATCNRTMCAYKEGKSVLKVPPSRGDDNNGDRGTSGSSRAGSGSAMEVEVQPDNRTVRCGKSDKCFALWKEDPNNKTNTIILVQGCWDASGKCELPDCESDGRTRAKNMTDTRFCCCAGHMCNLIVREGDLPPVADEDEDDLQIMVPGMETANYYGRETWIIILTVVVSALVLASLGLLKYRRWWLVLHKPSADAMHLMESSSSGGGTSGSAHSPTLDMEHLRLIEMVGRGRYGTVWRGTLGGGSLNSSNDGSPAGAPDEVAVKVFVHQHRQYYLNERDIYTLPFMEHPSITRFLGGEERPCAVTAGEHQGTPLAGPEYYLVMAHAPYGCLQDYLRRGPVDWTALCRMTQSIAKGLAHMHTDIRRGDKTKPCISHRDINSRNVLVKSDLSCALCDMGFAMKIAGSKYYGHNGEEQHAETTSLADVGTLRYMAPEVLEGAVNLRDCESSLKQIDVYAFGLVLWEVASRCSDLYQGLEVPAYRLPFEAEIGQHPTFEQMQVLVSKHKARPLFPDIWKDTNLAVRLLKETIEDCWDQDAEARLTSLCVEERLQELPILWDRHKSNIGVSGVSPTVNQTSSNRTSCNAYGPNTTNGPTLPPAPQTDALANELTDRNANIMGIVSLADTANAANILAGRGYAPVVAVGTAATNWQRAALNNRESSVSENTVETTVTWSPSEPPPDSPPPMPTPAGKNAGMLANNHAFPWLPVPLQPHQGRNPCLERNMIMEPLEELAISGNTLLDRGTTRHNTSRGRNDGLVAVATSPDMGELIEALHLVDQANNAESHALVSHDILGNQSAPSSSQITTRNGHPPIPYLQNAVHGPSSTPATAPVGCPKQPNIPGNGHSSVAKRQAHHQQQQLRNNRKGSSAKRLAAGTTASSGATRWGSGIRSLFDWTRLTRGAGSGGEEEADKAATRRSNFGGGESVAQRAMSDSTLNAEKSSNLNGGQPERQLRNQFHHHNHHPQHHQAELQQQHHQRQPLLSNHKVQTKVCLLSNNGAANNCGDSSGNQTTVVRRLTSNDIHQLPNGLHNNHHHHSHNNQHQHLLSSPRNNNTNGNNSGDDELDESAVRTTNGSPHYRSAELGVAKLRVPPGYAPVVRTRSGSLLLAGSEQPHQQSGSPARRPNTLSLKEPAQQFGQLGYLVSIVKEDDNSRRANYYDAPSRSSGSSEVSGHCNDRKVSIRKMRVDKPLNTDRCVSAVNGDVGSEVDELDDADDADDDDGDNVTTESSTALLLKDAADDRLSRQKIEQRVKTPFQLKPGRFSLCDDRMMSSWPAPTSNQSRCSVQPGATDSATTKLSLSVPVDINSLCSVQADSFLRRCHHREDDADAGGASSGQTASTHATTDAVCSSGISSDSSSESCSSVEDGGASSNTAVAFVVAAANQQYSTGGYNNLRLIPPYAGPLTPPASIVIRDRLNNHNKTIYQVS